VISLQSCCQLEDRNSQHPTDEVHTGAALVKNASFTQREGAGSSSERVRLPASARWPDTVSACRRLQNVVTALSGMSSACLAQPMLMTRSRCSVQPRTSLTTTDCRPSSPTADNDKLLLDTPSTAAAAAANTSHHSCSIIINII